MRRLLVGLVVAAVAALVPIWAFAGNQEVAEQIAAGLKGSGQLHGFKIGVKYQDGTAWLNGQVSSRDQLDAALQMVRKYPGVTRVVNNLAIVPTAAASAASQPADSSVRPLQQVNGALAAERLSRPASGEVRGPQSRPIMERELAVEQPIGKADRVQTVFAPSPAPQVNVTALQEPTLAPARGYEEVARPIAVAQPPLAVARNYRATPVAYNQVPAGPTPAVAAPAPVAGGPMPVAGAPMPPLPIGAGPVQYDHPNLPNYAWPCYAAHPNYAAVTYPKQYSPTAWPYIGPFYPYPQVPLGWRRVSLEWHDGWWNLNFDDGRTEGVFSGIFRPFRHY